MKDFDNIEDWYRDELSNYRVEPDKNGWDAIAENLDATTPLTENNISEWYKKEVSKLEERPDFTVWDKLSTNLDTASVWDKLVVSLDKYELLLWWKNLAFKGSAVFLLLLGSYVTYSNYSNEEIVIENKKTAFNKNLNYGFASLLGVGNNTTAFFASTITTENKLTNTSQVEVSSTSHEISRATNSVKAAILESKPKNNNTSNHYASINEIKHFNSKQVENLEALKLKNERDIVKEITTPTISEKDIIANYSSKEFLVKKEKNRILFNQKRFAAQSSYLIQAKRIYIGANVGVRKQGMITQLKENSPLKDYKQKILLDFGTNFGGVLGVIVSNKFNLETNVSINSTSGYKRAFSSEGIAYQENLNLNYTSVNLLAKKMNSRSTFDNRIYSTNLIGGAYFSYLRTAVSDINGATRNLEEFNNTDYGIVLGIEQDRYVSKTLVVTPGIRYNQGIANIVNDASPFKSGRNFSLEFNLGVKYIFTK